VAAQQKYGSSGGFVFGFGKKAREERQKEEVIEYLLDLLHKEMADALRIVGDVFDVGYKNRGPLMAQPRYMAMLFHMAFVYGQGEFFDNSTIKNGYMRFYSSFPKEFGVEQKTLQALKDPENEDLIGAAAFVVGRIQSGTLSGEKREQLMVGLAEIYLGVSRG